jgi:hypothetical protein
LCTVHPNIAFFHHRPSDLHFDLDCPHCLVWAAVIVSHSFIYTLYIVWYWL